MRKPGYSAALSCVLVRAESAARELGSGVTGTEHLLLALAQEKISSAGPNSTILPRYIMAILLAS